MAVQALITSASRREFGRGAVAAVLASTVIPGSSNPICAAPRDPLIAAVERYNALFDLEDIHFGATEQAEIQQIIAMIEATAPVSIDGAIALLRYLKRQADVFGDEGDAKAIMNCSTYLANLGEVA